MSVLILKHCMLLILMAVHVAVCRQCRHFMSFEQQRTADAFSNEGGDDYLDLTQLTVSYI